MFQEKSKHSTSVRSVNSITRSDKKFLNFKTYKLPLVKINPKSATLKVPRDMVIKKEKKEMDISSKYWLFGS